MKKEILITNEKQNPLFDFWLGIADCFKWHAIYIPHKKKGYERLAAHGKTPEEALKKLLKNIKIK